MGDGKKKIPKNHMLAKRILGGSIVAMVGLLLIFGGEWIYTIGISLALATAAWEYISMFKRSAFSPNHLPVVCGTFIIALLSKFDNSMYAALGWTLIIFSVLIIKIIHYKDIKQSAAFDMAIELSTLTFIALPGSYLIHLRMLSNGLYWALISILPACIADIAAYAFGSLIGKHKLAPILSPKKTVEGYISGVFAALISGFGIHFLFQASMSEITLTTSLVISLIVGLVSPLGDLAKSIIKRTFSLDDTGNLIPGHGGILDRIDTWLWAAPIGYFLAVFFYI